MKSKIKLAFVDDNIVQQFLVKTLVERMGIYEILFICKNGLELLDELACAVALPEICILDLNMPIMSGKLTAQEISERFPTIKVFAYTSTDDPREVAMLKEHGVLKVFNKKNPASMLNEISLLIN